MNRRQFTKNIVKLIQLMIDDKNEPILDYTLRSKEEQLRLYNLGLSKCDGTNKVSKHQSGLACDIYFVYGGGTDSLFIDYGYEYTKNLSEKYHAIWEQMGGKPAISWDLPHYEA